MIKRFLAAVSLLVLAFLSMGLHLQYYDHGSHDVRIQALSRLTMLPGVLLSTEYFETKRGAYGAPALNAYVELPAVDRMDYVYAK